MPRVAAPIYCIIHMQGFPHATLPNFQPVTIPQQLPHFVPGGQPLFSPTAVISASSTAAEFDPNDEIILKEFMETLSVR